MAGRTLCFVVCVRCGPPVHKCRRVSVQEKFYRSIEFFPYSFPAFFGVLFAKQFSFLVAIFVVVCFALAVLPVGLRFFCCSVVSFVLPFSVGINAILHQLLLLFLAVPPPYPTQLYPKCPYVFRSVLGFLMYSLWFASSFFLLCLFCLF